MKYLDRTNGHAPRGNGLNGTTAVAPRKRARPKGRQAEDLVATLRDVVRKLFIVDDEASELPLRQLRVCMILADGAKSMSAISRELGVSLSAITQIADRLQAAGLASRLPEGEDRRVRYLQLTPRGRQIMQRRERIKLRRAEAALKQLRPAERNRALAAIATLQRACQESRKP